MYLPSHWSYVFQDGRFLDLQGNSQYRSSNSQYRFTLSAQFKNQSNCWWHCPYLPVISTVNSRTLFTVSFKTNVADKIEILVIRLFFQNSERSSYMSMFVLSFLSLSVVVYSYILRFIIPTTFLSYIIAMINFFGDG